MNERTEYKTVQTPLKMFKLRDYLGGARQKIKERKQERQGLMHLYEAAHTHQDEAEANDTAQAFDSDNLAEAVQQDKIKRLPNKLLKGAALLGSTNHNWRRGTEENPIAVETLLNQANIPTYNPDMGDGWDWDKHPKVEALALSEFAVLAMRIENAPGMEDASLGSLVEIGIAAFSAHLRGQKFLISFAPDFQKSLKDPGAIAQFESLKVNLETLQKQHPELIQVVYDEDREALSARTEQAVKEQETAEYKGLTQEAFERFAELRRQRLSKPLPFVTIGGSSSAFHKSLRDNFTTEQMLIENTWDGAHNVSALYKGGYAAFWDEADNVSDPFRIQMMMQRAFLAEVGPKTMSDVLVWKVQSEAISQAAITEIGFMLLNALENGQQFVLLLEPFNIDLYVQTAFAEDSRVIRRWIREQEKTEKFTPEDIQQARDLINLLEEEPEKVTFGQIRKNKVLAATPQFKKADNAKRTRSIAEEQLLKIQSTVKELTGDLGIELFVFATDITDFVQKNKLVNSKEAFAGREAYYENYKKFRDTLDVLRWARPLGPDGSVDPNGPTQPIGPEDAVSAIDEALHATVAPRETRFKGLTQHLNEVHQDAVFWEEIIPAYESTNGESFLTPHHLRLISEYVAPLHDLLKFLGDPTVQSIPDHEILIGLVTKDFLAKVGMPPEDVAFITAVVSDHENIFKERGRAAFATSKNPIDRAKSLFFVMDTLTGAISEENGVIRIDQDKLRSRFTDLYFRHIDLVAGKVFRPQWGKASIESFVAVFEELGKTGITFEEGFYGKIISAGLEAIDRSLTSNQDRQTTNQGPVFTEQQLVEVEKAQVELETLLRKYT